MIRFFGVELRVVRFLPRLGALVAGAVLPEDGPDGLDADLIANIRERRAPMLVTLMPFLPGRVMGD